MIYPILETKWFLSEIEPNTRILKARDGNSEEDGRNVLGDKLKTRTSNMENIVFLHQIQH